MRRFILTYQRYRDEQPPIDIEGVRFSDGTVVLELYPDNDWHGTREFRNLDMMDYSLLEFGERSIKWLDEEPKP